MPTRQPDSTRAIRIANCSGFYGDRLSAAREQVEGGEIDVLTGDWLAELTMLILAKDRQRRGEGGYARTFITQMEEVLATCLERGVRIVTNAGGLDPAGCAAEVQRIADEAGLPVTIARVEGDDIVDRLDELDERGIDLVNLDTGERLAELGVEPVTANAYLGGWGIREALRRGADVVVTGRVTDAAVVVGPAAWWWGWDRTDWDALAGAVVAGHVIECGTQCTGGNYAFFEEIPGLEHPGFPIAEVHDDGSSTITKHPDTGGAVTVGTVTAQLLYEIQGLTYLNPDASTRLNSIRLVQEAPDRVVISDVRGLPGPTTTKVAINSSGGWRNTMTLAITGLDVEAKAALAERTLWGLVPGGRDAFDEVDVRLVRHDRPDPATNEEALAELRITVKDPDRDRVGRAFSNRTIEMVLASYPGFFTTTPPTDASAFGVYWPASIPADFPRHQVVMGDDRTAIAPPPTEPPPMAKRTPVPSTDLPAGRPAPTVSNHPETLSTLQEDLTKARLFASEDEAAEAAWDVVPTVDAPLGRVVGARSGDKGGNANVGVWARTDDAFDWLAWYLDEDRLRALMPAETDGLPVERFLLPNLRAMNLVIGGLLGRGVAASTRTDPQAKGLGEYLRAKVVPVPERLLRRSGELPGR
jgi:hypothetical protein